MKHLAYLSTLFVLTVSSAVFGEEVDWGQPVIRDDTVTTYAREVTLNDRNTGAAEQQFEIKTVADIPHSIDAVFSKMSDFGTFADWFDKTERVERLEREDGLPTAHIYMNMPFPVKDRDMILSQVSNKQVDGKIVVEAVNFPDLAPIDKKYHRVPWSRTVVTFEELTPDLTRVEYVSLSDMDISIPSRILRNQNAGTIHQSLLNFIDYIAGAEE